MNGDVQELLREGVDQFTADMRVPADLLARARTRMRRRKIAVRAALACGTAAVTAAAVIAAVAAPALLPGSNGTSPARLAAWTVTTRPGGRITVTIRELRDPAGLQRQLRADGVPATVRFTGQTPRPCLYYPLLPKQGFRLQARIFPQASNTSGHTAFTINTTAIPARIGLWITLSRPATQAAQDGLRSTVFAASWTLVYASGHCPPVKPAQNFSGGGVTGASSSG